MSDLYFQELTQALQMAGISQPTLVIDKHRLDRNIDHLIDVMNRGFDYRLVAKSLPSIPLIQHIMRRTGTIRLMSFHLPFLMHVVEHIPSADILLGKPMPVAAAKHFYQWHQRQTSSMCFDPSLQLQWLIDTPQRLHQYHALAQAHNMTLRINLEIDIGLHRGGFQPDDDFTHALQYIERSPFLELSGLMGYEAHISKLPRWISSRQQALQQARTRYQQFLDIIQQQLGDDALTGLCLNTGGSTTYTQYHHNDVANELATASALVKPSDFDVDTLDNHQAAAFIAAPVLKTVAKPELPCAPALSALLRATGMLARKGAYIYGGNWLASPCYPADAARDPLLGHSSNQEFYRLADDHPIDVDDFLFFRPHQSEAVFLQFGQIAVYEDGRISEYWPVFTDNSHLVGHSSDTCTLPFSGDIAP